MVGVVDLTCEKGKQHKGDVSVLIPDDKGHLYSGGADGLIKVRTKKKIEIARY